MTPLVLLSTEGKRSSKYFPNSASMASSRVAVMRKRYNQLFYRVLGIMHVRTDAPRTYRTAVEWRYACAADGFKAVWLDGSETRETCYDGFKAIPTALKPARRF